ncbi:hypothetical protein D3C77_518090 [compost metagenome]
MLAYRFKELRIVVGRAARPGFERALFNALVRIRNEQLRIDDHLRAESVTFRTSPEGTVEGKHPWGQLFDAESTNRAGEIRAEAQLLLADNVDQQLAARHFERGFDRVRQPAPHLFLNDDPVDDHFDRVLLVLLQLDILGEIALLPVYPDTDKALLGNFGKKALVLALLPGNYRR